MSPNLSSSEAPSRLPIVPAGSLGTADVFSPTKLGLLWKNWEQ